MALRVRSTILFLMLVTVLGAVSAQIPQRFAEYAANDVLVLMVDAETGELALQDVRNGYVWWSNPPARDDDPIARGRMKMDLFAQIIVEYVDLENNNTRFTENNYTTSVRKDGVTVEPIANGARITYHFPREELTIPLEYVLGEDYLEASVLPPDIEDTDRRKLLSVGLLPYFGAPGSSESGYLFIPDGCGALINLNNGKTRAQGYFDEVYGEDPSSSRPMSRFVKESIHLPVFGIKRGDNAFLAVITEGDTIATVAADVGGDRTSYNYVHAGFRVRPVDTYVMGSDEREVDMFGDSITSLSRCTVRYYPLPVEDADYSGMASRYREFLIHERSLPDSLPGPGPLVYVDLIGAIEKTQPVLGLPVDAIVPLTTFEQASEVMAAAQENGISRTVYRYLGWMGRSIRHELPNRLTFSREVGNRRDLDSLLSVGHSEGPALFLDVDCVTLYGSSAGFTPFFNSARSLGKDPAEQYRYSPSTYYRDEQEALWYLLEPDGVARVAGKVLEWFGKLPSELGLSLSRIPNTVYSDFARRGSERYETVEIWRNVLDVAKSHAGPLFASSAHAYALSYLGHIVDVPVRSSLFRIADASIPFYQLVINGSVCYAGRPVNLAGDPELQVLYALETGGSLHYELTAEPGIEIVGSAYDYLYSTDSRVWVPAMAAHYRTLRDVRARVEDSRMVAHETALPEVTTSTYENGVRIVVNYSRRAVVVDGVSVGPRDFALLDGGTDVSPKE